MPSVPVRWHAASKVVIAPPGATDHAGPPAVPEATIASTRLLIPTLSGRFGDETRGGRRFDAMPGLHLALAEPIMVDAHLTLQDETELVCEVPVPAVEAAVVLKAYAWSDRWAQTTRDTIDLSNLFHILDAHGAEAVGGWSLHHEGTTGARGDASRILLSLAMKLRARRAAAPAIDTRKLEVLIRRWVRA
ncbi:hypothetical protein BIU96_12975 [Curtobacterium sp. MCBA15_008]|nr:hypothetical protein BIU96_12975 [Curtobacterium sp. MCBA15_008]